MTTYLIVGLASGIIFVLLDFVLNVNPLARRLSEPYAPISRKGIRLIAPVVIDLLYGLAMAGIFLLLRPARGDGHLSTVYCCRPVIRAPVPRCQGASPNTPARRPVH